MNLNEAKLQQRSKELDAREEYLDIKLKALEEAPITLSVYESRVKAYERKLTGLIDLIKESENEVEAISHKYDIAYQTHNNLTVEITRREKLGSEKLNDIKKQESNVKKNIIVIKNEVKQQKDYLKEQQLLIDQTITQGNKRLLELQDEAGSIEHEIIEFKGARTALEHEIDNMAVTKIHDEQNLYDSLNVLANQKQSLEDEIKMLIDRITKKSAEYQRVEKETTNKLNILREKEESITAKRDAMRLERQELEEDKRRFTSLKSLYED